ncbi:MAG: 16S rRNA (adenine(1518)-N(6)/adenine(1519)-N(6))-dimethyltransferase RsmA [Rhodospirillales bacterium]|nr:16S rRNA (adenine(1518)-N(6)/adenine(1519)-N(6))-dimethyltransferase RsmA [Rhodospirillales bacterium]
MADFASLPSLRDVADAHGFRARRSLGQNFLFDENLLDRIARIASDLSDTHVIEIGPGPGGLTRALLRAGAHSVTAIDKDRRCRDALADLIAVSDGRLHFVEADAMEVDVESLGNSPFVVVGNLPFNIATELLMRLVVRNTRIDRMVLMFQKEVGERIAAQPGTRSYGRLSVIVQWLCQAETCFEVPARAFVPPPKVSASVLRIAPRAEPLAPAPEVSLKAVTAAAFGQRRKTLRNSLKSAFPDPVAALEAAGIKPEVRAETVGIEDFCALAREHAMQIG